MDHLKVEAKKALNFDPIAVAERLTGENYKSSKPTLGLGLLLQQAHGQHKRRLFSEMGDTYFMMPWADFVEVVTTYGFELLVQRRFAYQYKSGDVVEEILYPEQLIAAHREKKLLLHATSWLSGDKETVNGGKVYGCLEAESLDVLWSVLGGCSSSYVGETRRLFDRDVREGLLFALNEMEASCNFVDWGQPDRLIFLDDYAEEKGIRYDYDKARDEFLSTAPDWVRAFIL